MPDGWRVFDANKEIPVRSYRLEQLLLGDKRILDLYPDLRSTLASDISDGRVDVRSPHLDPAPRAAMLHRLTRWTSDYLWVSLIFFALLSSWAVERRRRQALVPCNV